MKIAGSAARPVITTSAPPFQGLDNRGDADTGVGAEMTLLPSAAIVLPLSSATSWSREVGEDVVAGDSGDLEHLEAELASDLARRLGGCGGVCRPHVGDDPLTLFLTQIGRIVRMRAASSGS